MTGGAERFAGPEYGRLLTAVRRSLERTGGQLTGQVTVSQPTDEERRALIGLTGQHRPPGVGRIAVSLASLDETVFVATGQRLPDLVVAVHGRPLRNRPDERARSDIARAQALAAAKASPLHAECAWFRRWLEEIGPTITKMVNQRTTRRLLDAVRVLEMIESSSDSLLLPMLAEAATGDTKALGRGTPTATLVLRALAIRAGDAMPVSSDDIRQLWDDSGVVMDDLASRVLVLNLPADGDGLGEWLSGAATYGTPFQVTLQQLLAHPISITVARAFICENPAVLRRAAQQLSRDCPPMLCTEGRPSAAFHRLARIVTGGGGQLGYHGDFDWDGIDIAAGVMARHGASPWLMSAAQYRAVVGTQEQAIPLRGKPRPTPWDTSLSDAMREAGVAVYEEAVTDPLIESLTRM